MSNYSCNAAADLQSMEAFPAQAVENAETLLVLRLAAGYNRGAANVGAQVPRTVLIALFYNCVGNV